MIDSSGEKGVLDKMAAWQQAVCSQSVLIHTKLPVSCSVRI